MVNRKVIAMVSVALGFAAIGCEEKAATPAAPKPAAPKAPAVTPPATPAATPPATPEKPAAPK